MPQMKPINWLILYFILNLILILMNIMNYFYININITKNNKIYKTKKMKIWKW